MTQTMDRATRATLQTFYGICPGVPTLCRVFVDEEYTGKNLKESLKSLDHKAVKEQLRAKSKQDLLYYETLRVSSYLVRRAILLEEWDLEEKAGRVYNVSRGY